MNKIRSLSLKISLILKSLIYIIPLVTIFYWIYPELFNAAGINLYYDVSNGFGQTVNTLSQAIGFFISLLPMGIMVFFLKKLNDLFVNYANGKVFTLDNANTYKVISKSLFFLVVARIVSDTLLSLALSFQNPPGERYIGISFGATDITLIITGLVVLLVSHVMYEAHMLDDEVRYTV